MGLLDFLIKAAGVAVVGAVAAGVASDPEKREKFVQGAKSVGDFTVDMVTHQKTDLYRKQLSYLKDKEREYKRAGRELPEDFYSKKQEVEDALREAAANEAELRRQRSEEREERSRNW